MFNQMLFLPIYYTVLDLEAALASNTQEINTEDRTKYVAEWGIQTAE
jgi:hypothetical protein